ncbi:MAG: Clp protease N-terminal domain-containing protein, partial [Candidatus Aenigmatarchaeota archaeon]
MNLEKFTLKAQEAITNALESVKKFSQQEVLPEHLLYSLIEDKKSIVRETLIKLGINCEELLNRLNEFFSSLPKVYGSGKEAYVSSRFIEVVNYAKNFSKEFGDEYISSEHLLLGLAKENNSFFK